VVSIIKWRTYLKRKVAEAICMLYQVASCQVVGLIPSGKLPSCSVDIPSGKLSSCMYSINNKWQSARLLCSIGFVRLIKYAQGKCHICIYTRQVFQLYLYILHSLSCETWAHQVRYQGDRLESRRSQYIDLFKYCDICITSNK
jgi:hypothetical protein